MNETSPTPQRPTELPPEIAAKSVLGLRGTELEKRKRFPRARRWIFNFAAALSLVLFVGNYWLWLRGLEGISDKWGFSRFGDSQWSLESYSGHTTFKTYRGSQPSDCARTGYYSSRIDSAMWIEGRYAWTSLHAETRAFEWFSTASDSYSTWTGYYISIPKWFLQLLFAVLPLWWLGRSALRWSERDEGVPRCGMRPEFWNLLKKWRYLASSERKSLGLRMAILS